jgi:hypothetical protein
MRKFFPGGPALPPAEWIHKASGNQAAVVLIHGFTGDAVRTWPAFGRLLVSEPRLRGWDVASLRYQTSLLPDFEGVWRGDAPIARLAKLLGTTCSLGDLADYRALSFVVHSMGGLVLQRALVDDAALARKTRHVFLFGTPSAGLSKTAPVRTAKRVLEDMADDSAFIADLRARWDQRFGSDAPFQLFAVAGENDEFVDEESAHSRFPRERCQVIPGDHVQIVKADQATDAGVQLVIRGICGDAAPAGPWNAARVALEMGEFHEAIAQFGARERWPGLDSRAKVSLALALESVGRADDALALLETAGAETTDLIGMLGGRLKRRWLIHRQKDDATRAAERYRTGYERSTESSRTNHEQAFYHAINCAFMALVADGDRDCAADWAHLALEHTNADKRDCMWKFATEGEANLILSDLARSEECYGMALQHAPAPREMASMYQQARRIATACEDRMAEQMLERVFRPSQSTVSG